MTDKLPVDAKIIGARVQRFRLDRQLSQEDLARGAGISRTTLQKLEAGTAVRHETLKKIAAYVREMEWDFTQSIEDWDKPYRVYAPEEHTWLVTFNTPKSTRLYEDGAPVTDAEEKNRLGRLGFVSAFSERISCDLREGKLRAAIAEIYGDAAKGPFRHPEEEFVYCIRGEVRVTVGSDEIDLQAGQAMTFWSTQSHSYSLPTPLREGDAPALILMVWRDGKAIHSDESSLAKRKPRTPKTFKRR